MSAVLGLVAALTVVGGLPVREFAVPAAGAEVGDLELVSVSSSGTQGNDVSDIIANREAISHDGRFVAFNSRASNLVPGDTNGVSDIFVRDLVQRTTTRVSVSSSGGQGNAAARYASISGDGRFVAFHSAASNLVAGDTNGVGDTFVRDLVTGTTERVSVDTSGVQGNDNSWEPAISADGNTIAFRSYATNLSASDTNGYPDVFVHDRDTGVTERVSVASAGVEGNEGSWVPVISADGRTVAFRSYASNLVSGDTNGAPDIFVHDRNSGVTERVSVSSSGAQGNGWAYFPSISADGRFVAFASEASLVSGDTNNREDAFVHDRTNGTTVQVSVSSAGVPGDSYSQHPAISPDGRFVAFDSSATNLVADDPSTEKDIYVHDLAEGLTERLALGRSPSISGSGMFVTFYSRYTNGIPDTNGTTDVFVHHYSDGLPPQAEPTGGPILAQEGLGGCMPCSNPSRAYVTDYPIDTMSGAFFHSFDDLSIPGRGPAIGLSRSYDSQRAQVDGPFGFGWTSSYAMSLDVDGTTATVHQESGAQVTFSTDGTTWSAPPRMFASLADNGDGTWTFERRDREFFDFDSSGRLIAIRDLNGYETTVTYPDASTQTITDPAGQTLTLSYSAGRVVSATDSTTPPRTIAYAYDANGDLTDVIDVGGGHWTFSYDASHRMLTMRSPRFYGDTTTSPSPEVTNIYDGQGRVLTQTDPIGRTTTFDYTTVPGSTLVTDPKDNTTKFKYEYGLLITVTRGYGAAPATWQYRYDPDTLGRTITMDPNGKQSTATFDADGNMLGSTDPLGRTTLYTYNTLRQVTSITEPQTVNGQPVVRTMTYDSAGNPLTSSAPLLDATGAVMDTAATVFHYDDPLHPGDVTSVTDPNGNTATYTYDTYGNRTSSAAPPTPENSSGNTTTFAYNDRGWLTATTSPRGNLTGANAADHTTTFDHDAYGRTTVVTDALAGVTTTTYDQDGNIATVTDDNQHTTTYVHNAAAELIETVRPDNTVLRTEYWPDGNVHRQYNAADQPTTYTYDSLGHPASTTDPLNRTTTTSYDAAGNLSSVTTASGNTTTYTYDDANQLTGIAYSDPATSDVTAIAYDANGRRTSMTDGTGTTSWTWDSLGRLTETTNGAGATVSYGYDIGNRQTTIAYPGTTGTVTRTYDAANRIATIIDWDNQTTTFDYDADSNLRTRSNPNGTTTTIAVDNMSRTTGIDHALTGTPTSPFAAFDYVRDGTGLISTVTADGVPAGDHSWDYDPLDQLTGVDGSLNTFTYDPADNLTVAPDGDPQSFDAASQLTRAGPVIELVDANAAGSNSGTSLTVPIAGVDQGDVIVAATTLPKNKSATTPVGYTLLGEYSSGSGGQSTELAVFTKTATGSETDVVFGYSASFGKSAAVAVYRNTNANETLTVSADAAVSSGTTLSLATTTEHLLERVVALGGSKDSPGTWTSTAMDPQAQATGGDTDTVVADLTRDAAGPTGNLEVTHSTTAGLAGVLLRIRPDGVEFTFDADGNRTAAVTANDTVTTLDYDAENRLVSHTTPTTAATYAYDGNGLRSSKTVGGTTTEFTWDTTGALGNLLHDGARMYLYGPGGILAHKDIGTGDRVEYHHDQLGTIRASTDTNGTVAATQTFDPWGNLTGTTGAIATSFGYAGQYADAESGYQYLRARYYDPLSGQFLNRDPLVSKTQDPYGYAANNPVNFTDPTGLEWYDPRDWDQDVVNIAKDVGGRAVDVTVATVNAPVTATTSAVNSWTGGDCDWAKSLTVVCYGGFLSSRSPGDAYVTGSTINTPLTKKEYRDANDGNLHRHETWHTRQWALFGGGPIFPALYGLETLRTGGDECQNVFEIWAGLEDGGYK